MTPNIFQYATKELSQDAVICWLVSCAKEAKGDLRECGLSFVQALMLSGGARVMDARSGNETHHAGAGQVTRILEQPTRQYGGIDIYFRAEVDGRVVSFVIEDKTDTEMHGGQLERYRGLVGGDEIGEDLVKAVLLQKRGTCSTTSARKPCVPAIRCSGPVTSWGSSRTLDGGRHTISCVTMSTMWRVWSAAGSKPLRTGALTWTTSNGSSWWP